MSVGVLACQQPSPQLTNGHPTAAALAAAMLEHLEQGDEAALRALEVSEPEFRERVWPELPAARPERNVPVAYAWQDLHQKSRVGLASTLSQHGGRRYRFAGIRFRGGTTTYRTFAVHRESIVTVIDGDGIERDVRLFGSAIELQGQLKVFSYVVD